MNPSRSRSGESRIARRGGGTSTWLQKIEKFSAPSAPARSTVSAVDGAVDLEADCEEDDVAVGVLACQAQRVEWRVDHSHVGPARLCVEQRPVGRGHAQHVGKGREDHSVLLGNRDRVVLAARRDHADRAARAVHELNLGWQQVLDAVAVDRVRMPAGGDLHQLVPAPRFDERGDSLPRVPRRSPPSGIR